MCGHINSFAKARTSLSTPSNGGVTADSVLPLRPINTADSNLSLAETIWPVYRDWIIYGRVDPSIGEYRVWKPDDEFDPVEKANTTYRIEEGAKL